MVVSLNACILCICKMALFTYTDWCIMTGVIGLYSLSACHLQWVISWRWWRTCVMSILITSMSAGTRALTLGHTSIKLWLTHSSTTSSALMSPLFSFMVSPNWQISPSHNLYCVCVFVGIKCFTSRNFCVVTAAMEHKFAFFRKHLYINPSKGRGVD